MLEEETWFRVPDDIDLHPEIGAVVDAENFLGDVFSGPTETLAALNASADRDSSGRATLRAVGRQTARQRLRTRRAVAAVRRAHESWLRRMDDYYPSDIDYLQASNDFINLAVRAIAGDTVARTTLAEYLGIDTEAVFELIDALGRDNQHDIAALKAAIRAVLTLATQQPTDAPLTHHQPEIHHRDVTRSIAPTHGPTATSATSRIPGRVVVTAA